MQTSDTPARGLTECPNKCGTRIAGRRASIDRHRRLCRLEPVECPFAEVGCAASGLCRETYTEHMSSCHEAHLRLVMDRHQEATGTRSVVSPLEKLESIATEIDILEEILSKQGANPVLECIKTQLKLPTIRLRWPGESCTFRVSNILQRLESGEVWYSPPFYCLEDFKMCLSVTSSRLAVKDGCTHMYTLVSLLQLSGDLDQLPPRRGSVNGHLASLPEPGQGIKVLLLRELDWPELSESSDSNLLSFTWLFADTTKSDSCGRGVRSKVTVAGQPVSEVRREVEWCVSLSVMRHNSLVLQARLTDTTKGPK